MMARIARPLQSLRGAQWPQRATARCNYSAATLRRKTCVFPFARQREWMCQNYGHRAQRDATTARLRRALTADSLSERAQRVRGIARSAMQLQRGCAAPQNMCLSIRAAARMDVPKLLASRAARCNNSAATPRPHRWFFRANARSAFAASRYSAMQLPRGGAA